MEEARVSHQAIVVEGAVEPVEAVRSTRIGSSVPSALTRIHRSTRFVRLRG